MKLQKQKTLAEGRKRSETERHAKRATSDSLMKQSISEGGKCEADKVSVRKCDEMDNE